jgi:anthranilate synthase/indole-3-glycerol phosphate synthase/phosphoribosylanthranilate isomerase
MQNKYSHPQICSGESPPLLATAQLPSLEPLSSHTCTMALDLIDHSPHQPEAAPPLESATNVVLIDNFDSFTWNIYQYLVLEGASVTVFRNDAITVEALSALNPTQLVISPGPGHPKTDSGVSRDAIKHFAGKIPILGVCMGQ